MAEHGEKPCLDYWWCPLWLVGDGFTPQAQLPRPVGRSDRLVDKVSQQNAGDGCAQETQLHTGSGMRRGRGMSGVHGMCELLR